MIGRSADTAAVLQGRAYQRRATLELAGDTLTWRAQRGQLQPVAENIVTTIHDVRTVSWVERRWSVPGLTLLVAAGVWMAYGNLPAGAVAAAVAAALIAYRRLRPQFVLGLELGGRWLVLEVERASAPAARALAARIERRMLTGEVPTIPPTLP